MLAQEEREGKPASESSMLSQCLMRRQHEVLFLSGPSRLPVHVCRGLGSLAGEKLLFLYCFLWLFVNREDVPGIRASDQGLKETEPSGCTASGHPETLLSSGLTPLARGLPSHTRIRIHALPANLETPPHAGRGGGPQGQCGWWRVCEWLAGKLESTWSASAVCPSDHLSWLPAHSQTRKRVRIEGP
ncbi:unnamed protein product [Rangifer tarandus platyrhynchus]|uniref:Uncharacterized protein n=2 Tax=Rangifer tarandus platyrhynchus TaxID=3082113 RepID=A0AC59ZSB5_RANTA|nr:unnamed protein product [Rangifer tarandus platyrhynchus]